MTKHQENCSSPICADDKSKDTVWWAGEPICSKTPKLKIQQIQQRINAEFRKGKFQERSWTVKELLQSNL
jgi:hypothetical protein